MPVDFAEVRAHEFDDLMLQERGKGLLSSRHGRLYFLADTANTRAISYRPPASTPISREFLL